MAKVRLFKGKPLMVNGKVALSDNCCCGGGTSTCPPPATPTIQITFAGILICPPFLDISMNGTFTLTNAGGNWQGTCGQIFLPDIGPVDADCTVDCATPGDGTLHIDYSVSSDDPPLFIVSAEFPPITPVNNDITDCSFAGAFGGTATLIF